MCERWEPPNKQQICFPFNNCSRLVLYGSNMSQILPIEKNLRDLSRSPEFCRAKYPYKREEYFVQRYSSQYILKSVYCIWYFIDILYKSKAKKKKGTYSCTEEEGRVKEGFWSRCIVVIFHHSSSSSMPQRTPFNSILTLLDVSTYLLERSSQRPFNCGQLTITINSVLYTKNHVSSQLSALF
jgi:hypothetical protein